MVKAIETVYNGHRYRSRLEARWAVFFNTLGVKYEYEREGYDLGKAGWYLPDFWMPHFSPKHNDGKTGVFLEIKPAKATQEEYDKAFALAEQTGHNVFIFQGQPYENDYSVTQIQFWDLGRLETPIILEDLTFRARVESTFYPEFPEFPPLVHNYVQLGNGAQWAGGFTCVPFAFDMTKSQLDAAYLAARQARFEHRG